MEHLRILLVDDEPLLLESLEIILTMNHMEITGMAHDGYEALEVLSKHFCDLALVDLNMKGMGCIELISHMKTKYPKVKKCTREDKEELFQIAQSFHAKIVDYGKDSLLLEFVQSATKNDALIKLMKEEFQSIEVVRGGSVGIEAINMTQR